MHKYLYSYQYYMHTILYHSILLHAHVLTNENMHVSIGRIPHSVHRRQDTIPIIYVNGSHYEVGYMIVSIRYLIYILADTSTRYDLIDSYIIGFYSSEVELNRSAKGNPKNLAAK